AFTSIFNNNENTPTDMEVEATLTSSPQNKKKEPEQIIPPVKNTFIDLDQSFDAAENMLNNTQQKNTLHFECKTVIGHETEAELFCHYDNKYQPSLLDSISTQLVNISQQLVDIHNQLGFTLIRVKTIKTVLNITSISPKQADIINNNKYKNPLDDMEEEDNKVVTAGIDISKSIVWQQESQVTELQLENSILKNNLSDNYEKLNNALIAITQMQRLLIHHEILPENCLINITELIKSASSDYFNDNKINHIYCSDRLVIDIHTVTVIDVDEDFTDHNIAMTSIYISELVSQSNKAPAKKISFHYDKMSRDD
ncbi:6151_t:CDS:2, partial [Funneliformis geosporum]